MKKIYQIENTCYIKCGTYLVDVLHGIIIKEHTIAEILGPYLDSLIDVIVYAEACKVEMILSLNECKKSTAEVLSIFDDWALSSIASEEDCYGKLHDSYIINATLNITPKIADFLLSD